MEQLSSVHSDISTQFAEGFWVCNACLFFLPSFALGCTPPPPPPPEFRRSSNLLSVSKLSTSYHDSHVKKPGSANSLFMLLFVINTPWRIRGPALCKIPQLTRRKGVSGEEEREAEGWKRIRRNISTNRFFVGKCHRCQFFSSTFPTQIFSHCVLVPRKLPRYSIPIALSVEEIDIVIYVNKKIVSHFVYSPKK